jgi:hypothetical protein
MLTVSTAAFAQTLTIGVRSGPESIDPHFTATGSHAEALKHVFDTLVWSGDGLELEPRLGYAWLRQGGRALYAEAAHQVLARWHFSARQSLRAIVRYTATERSGATQDQATTGSLTWAWRESAGTLLYMGVSRNREGVASQRRSNEAFVKLQVDVDELRGRW